MASRVLMTISRDEVEQARLISEEKYILDTQSKLVHAKRQLVHAKRQGEARGMKKGHAEEKLEIARKMKKAGRPFSEITEFTDIPAETIQEL